MKKVIAILSWFLISCSTQNQSEVVEQTSNRPLSDIPMSLLHSFQAHGGLEMWKTYKSLSYTRNPDKDPEQHIIDLENRKVLISAENYKLGSDGENIWVSPDLEAYEGRSARFFHNLWFYFFSFPHILSDPGIKATELEKIVFNGKNYNRVKITYNENVGDSPDDQYILYLSSETNRLDFIKYSVTYYDRSRAENFNALIYEDWIKVNGLLVPTSLQGYKWENDSIGAKRYSVKFSDISFTKNTPDQSMFEMPQESEIEVRDEN